MHRQWTLYKDIRFEASHILPNHKGKCKNLHGHSYRVEVWVTGDRLDEMGFVVDFGDIADVIKRFDHTHLNAMPPFDHCPPTAENIAKHIAEVLMEMAQGKHVRVRVWETASSYAEYSSIPCPS